MWYAVAHSSQILLSNPGIYIEEKDGEEGERKREREDTQLLAVVSNDVQDLTESRTDSPVTNTHRSRIYIFGRREISDALDEGARNGDAASKTGENAGLSLHAPPYSISPKSVFCHVCFLRWRLESPARSALYLLSVHVCV